MGLTREQYLEAWEKTMEVARKVAEQAKIEIDYRPLDQALFTQAWSGATAKEREEAQKKIDTHHETYIAGLRELAVVLREAFANLEPLPPLNLAQRLSPNAPPKPAFVTKRLEPGEEGPDPMLEYRRDNNAWLEQWYYPFESAKVVWLLLKEAWEERRALKAAQADYE